MLIVIFDDQRTIAGQVRSIVEKRLKGSPVNAEAYTANWLENATSHSGPDVLWLVDLYGKELGTQEKKLLNKEFRQFLDRNATAKRIYDTVPLHEGGQREVSTYCGLAIAAIAYEKGIPFRIMSSYKDAVARLVAFLVTGDEYSAAEYYSFDKKYFAMPEPSSHPDAIKEYDRLVEFVKGAKPSLQQFNVPAQIAIERSPDVKVSTAEAANDKPTTAATDSVLNSKETAPTPTVPWYSRTRNLILKISTCVSAVIAFAVLIYGLDPVQNRFKRRNLGHISVTELQTGKELTELEVDKRSSRNKLHLELLSAHETLPTAFSVYLLENDGNLVRLPVSPKQKTRLQYPENADDEDWYAKPGINILLLFAEFDDPLIMNEVKRYWGKVDGLRRTYKDFRIDYDPDNNDPKEGPVRVDGYNGKASLPREIQALLDILKDAYDRGAVDDFSMRGFVLPALPESSDNAKDQP